MLAVHHSDLVIFMLAVLAGWRLTALAVFERGPQSTLVLIRRKLVQLGLERLATCFHCASLWAAMIIVALTYEPSWFWLLLMPAVAGGISVIQLHLDHQGTPTQLTEEETNRA